MKVVYKEPGRDPEIREIPNELKNLQDAVGGPIETVRFARDACVICNEEGRLMGLQHNLRFLGVDLVGTIVVAGVDGEDFCDLKAEDAALVIKSMGLTQKKPGGDAKAGKSAEVMWLCCTGDRPVGLVKAWDGYEGQWKYYIGTGYGLDLDEDVECIMALGQRYYDLSFIQDFCREPKRSGSGVLPGQLDIEDVLGVEHEQQ